VPTLTEVRSSATVPLETIVAVVNAVQARFVQCAIFRLLLVASR
jgi:hypothetical protein